MIPEAQRDIFAFLARPETHGLHVERVEQVHTHISAVFLAGGHVFKLKRAVRLPFVDFTDLETRHQACEDEVRLNRRGAPDLYEGVVSVTRDAEGRLAVDGTGEVVDWLVVMRRFEEQNLFSRLLVRGELPRQRAMDLARVVVAYHAGAEVIPCADNAARMIAVARGNRDSMLSVPEVLSQGRAEALTARTVAALNGVAPLLTQRGQTGRVRRCHGDLHLRNICLWNDKPTLFDAIEFSDDFAVIDTLYDLAFLLMDLDQRGFRRLASIVMNHAMEYDPDIGGLAALPVFLSMRAGIRAHINATMSLGTSDPAHAQELARRASSYMDRAFAYLAPPGPRLIAVGGLSGSGKSRLAREVAPHVGAAPGALVSRTDVLRKRLLGKEPYDHLGPEGYTPEVTRATYAALNTEVRAVLRQGHSVIADGVFATPAERADIEAVARDMGVPFQGLWLEAPDEVAMKRIESRRHNASDATADVLLLQRTLDIGPMAWSRIDSSGPRRETLAQARAIVGL